MGNHIKNTPHPNTNLYRTVGNHVVDDPVGHPYAPTLLLLMVAGAMVASVNYCGHNACTVQLLRGALLREATSGASWRVWGGCEGCGEEIC